MHPQDTTTPEEWRPVVGWEGWYEVSDQARVRRVGKVRGVPPGRITTQRLTPKGYWATAVRQARALRAQGWEFTRIGRHFQVGEATIRDAVARRTWRHI